MLSPVPPGGAVSGALGASVTSVAVSSSGQSSLSGVAAAGVSGTTTSASGTNTAAVVGSGSVAVGVGISSVSGSGRMGDDQSDTRMPLYTDEAFHEGIRFNAKVR